MNIQQTEIMSDYFREMAQSLVYDIRFFGNAGKEEREWWILEHWHAFAFPGMKPEAVKQETPDFLVGEENMPVEIMMVPEKERKIHQEKKKDLGKIENRIIPMHPYRPGNNAEQGAQWIAQIVKKKIDKYRNRSISTHHWTLVVYANFYNAREIDWEELKMRIADLSPQFKSIQILVAWELQYLETSQLEAKTIYQIKEVYSDNGWDSSQEKGGVEYEN